MILYSLTIHNSSKTWFKLFFHLNWSKHSFPKHLCVYMCVLHLSLVFVLSDFQKSFYQNVFFKCCLVKQLGALTVRIAQICFKELLLIGSILPPETHKQLNNPSTTVIQTLQVFFRTPVEGIWGPFPRDSLTMFLDSLLFLSSLSFLAVEQE